MSTTLILANKFDSLAADVAQLSQQATAIASTAPAHQAEMAADLASVTQSMTNMATRIAETLHGSLLGAKKVA